MAITRLRCESCGTETNERDAGTTCRKCGGLLSLESDAPDQRGATLREIFDWRLMSGRVANAADVTRSGVWRFRELVLPTILDNEVVSQWEGNTPLLQRESVSSWTGVSDVWLKHEGHNPTGSFKDRGMTVAISNARR